MKKTLSSALRPFLPRVGDSDYPRASLEDYCDRKSFYHKAEVCVREDGTITLYSYSTPCACVKGDRLFRLWGGWSATTGRHVNAFANLLGFGPLGKATWDSLEVARA